MSAIYVVPRRALDTTDADPHPTLESLISRLWEPRVLNEVLALYVVRGAVPEIVFTEGEATDQLAIKLTQLWPHVLASYSLQRKGLFIKVRSSLSGAIMVEGSEAPLGTACLIFETYRLDLLDALRKHNVVKQQFFSGVLPVPPSGDWLAESSDMAHAYRFGTQVEAVVGGSECSLILYLEPSLEMLPEVAQQIPQLYAEEHLELVWPNN